MSGDDRPRLAGSTHAIAHTLMLQSNLGLSREEAEQRTEEYLRDLDRISDAGRLEWECGNCGADNEYGDGGALPCRDCGQKPEDAPPF